MKFHAGIGQLMKFHAAGIGGETFILGCQHFKAAMENLVVIREKFHEDHQPTISITVLPGQKFSWLDEPLNILVLGQCTGTRIA
jgi:hypothetical protein